MSSITYVENNAQAGAIPVNTKVKATQDGDAYVQHVNVDSLPAVTGTVSVGNFPASYPVSFDASNLSAFNVLEIAERTPIIQGDWVHGLNTQVWQGGVATGTGAVVDTDAARLRIQSGTANNGFAYVLSRQPIRYRAGEGVVFLSTPIFTEGVADSTQLQGMGTVTNNVPYDGYFFGYNGTSFGVCHYVRGTPNWTAKADWNGTAVSWHDPTKGTPVMIKYPYLGYGNIMFFIQNQTTSAFELVHTIRYANTLATTQLSNPSLHFMSYTANSGNTSNLTMYNGSYGAFVSGQRLFVGAPKWAADASEAAVTTENVILSLRNATTYNGVPNRGMIRVNSVSISSSAANGIAVFRFKLNATVGGSPSFTAINGTTANGGVTITSGNSIASFDVAGTTVEGGTYIYSITCDNPNSRDVDLIPYNIFIPPGEVLTISGYSSSGSLLGVAVNWSEDI